MIPEAGSAVLALGALAGLAALATGLAGLARPVARAPARALATAHAAVLAGATLALALAFLASSVEIAYVWEHTDVAYPWYYKLSGLWAGQKGTVLLWGALLAVVAASVRGEDEVARVARLALVAVSTAFVLHAWSNGTFDGTAAGALDARPGGRGLQEVLVTPFMVIHPPVQFVAYALVAAPAAFAFAALALRAPASAWSARAMAWARPAWFAATLGLGLGGLWAYYVLSFGGFWAWDPVETANLLPWLALTAFLHAGKDHGRHGDFTLAAHALPLLAFALTLFASFATRSGLWVSVHAFTDPTARFSPDAAARLLAILDVHAPTRFFLGATLATSFLVSAFAMRHVAPASFAARAYAALATLAAAWAAFDVRSLAGAVFEAGALLPLGGAGAGAGAILAFALAAPWVAGLFRETGGPGFPALSERGLMHASVGIFAVALAVAFLLAFQTVNALDRRLFDARAPFVALPLVAVLAARMAWRPLGRTRALALGGGALALALVLYFAWRPAPVVAASIPVLAAGALASLAALVHANARPGTPRRTLAGGALLAASGILGMAFWANPPSDLDVGSLRLATDLPHGLVLSLAGFGALLAGVAVLSGTGRFAPVVGGALGVVAWGWGAGAALAVAGALVAPRPQASAFEVRRRLEAAIALAAGAFALAALALVARGALAGAWGLPLLALLLVAFVVAFAAAGRGLRVATGSRPRVAQALVQTGIHLVHLGLVLGLVGYATSTYAGETVAVDEAAMLAPGTTRDVGPFTLSLGAPVGSLGDANETWYRAIDVPLEVWRGDRLLDRATLRLEHRPDPIHHYDPVLDVRRGETADLYVTVEAMRVEGRWIRAHGDACFEPRLAQAGAEGACVGSLRVEGVALSVTRLPFVGLVWAGLWIMLAAMLCVLAGRFVARRVAVEAVTAQVYTARTKGG